MPSRRETFDAEDVLRRTRRRAAHVTAAPMAAVALTAVLVVLGRQGALPWTVVGGALGIGWVAATAWMNAACADCAAWPGASSSRPRG